jgi:hypothetical protein
MLHDIVDGAEYLDTDGRERTGEEGTGWGRELRDAGRLDAEQRSAGSNIRGSGGGLERTE